ncbi:unnamed protein product [Ixodes persulcatus]
MFRIKTSATQTQPRRGHRGRQSAGTIINFLLAPPPPVFMSSTSKGMFTLARPLASQGVPPRKSAERPERTREVLVVDKKEGSQKRVVLRARATPAKKKKSC